MSSPKSVNLYITDPCKIDGEHIPQGAILQDVAFELANDLVGAGKARLATDDDLAAAKKAVDAKKD